MSRARQSPSRFARTTSSATLLSDIAQETGLKVQDLIRQSRRAGIQLDSKPRQTPLFPEEADHLRRFAAGPAKPKPLTRVTYRPDPEGRISLEDYDRMEQDFVASLLAFGYLPARRDVKRFPNRSWARIVRHHRRIAVQKSGTGTGFSGGEQRNVTQTCSEALGSMLRRGHPELHKLDLTADKLVAAQIVQRRTTGNHHRHPTV